MTSEGRGLSCREPVLTSIDNEPVKVGCGKPLPCEDHDQSGRGDSPRPGHVLGCIYSFTHPDKPCKTLAEGRVQSPPTYRLSSLPPLTSLFGSEPTTLLVGLDEDGPDGALKVYLGARWKRVHLLVTDEAEKETFRRAWGTGGHVWMSPVPPPELLHVDPAPEASDA